MLQCLLILSHKPITIDFKFSSIVSTSLLYSNVWISHITHQSLLLYIMHSIIICSRITTFWINVTINYLLGWGCNISSSSYKIPSFYRVTDGKSPTWSTLSLIFNSAIRTPIDKFKWFLSIKNFFFLFFEFKFWSFYLT